jgi:hypothetical protein
MTIFNHASRRRFFAMGGAILAASSSHAVHAADSETETVAAAVEKMRVAMLAGDGAALKMLVMAQLTHGHSDGRLQDRDDFIKSLDGANAFKSLVLSKQTISLVGDNAIVRHIFDSENNLPEGKTSTAHISVLQVWKKQDGEWRLLARQAVALPR